MTALAIVLLAGLIGILLECLFRADFLKRMGR